MTCNIRQKFHRIVHDSKFIGGNSMNNPMSGPHHMPWPPGTSDNSMMLILLLMLMSPGGFGGDNMMMMLLLLMMMGRF
jgi:hypothetical protein